LISFVTSWLYILFWTFMANSNSVQFLHMSCTRSWISNPWYNHCPHFWTFDIPWLRFSAKIKVYSRLWFYNSCSSSLYLAIWIQNLLHALNVKQYCLSHRHEIHTHAHAHIWSWFQWWDVCMRCILFCRHFESFARRTFAPKFWYLKHV
jgi:hypothetical protein